MRENSQIVVDADDGVPGVHQLIQQRQNPGGICRVQAGRGLIENQYISGGLLIAQVRCELEALALAGKGRQRLA